MGEQNLEQRISRKVIVGQLVVLVEDVDGVEAGREGCIIGARDEMLTVGCQTSDRLQLVLAHPWQLLLREHFSFDQKGKGLTMSNESVDALPLTSVALLDAAVWREIDSEEPQSAAAFLEALSRLVGRWLMVRSDAPEMDAVTLLCKTRGYIAREHQSQNLPSGTVNGDRHGGRSTPKKEELKTRQIGEIKD